MEILKNIEQARAHVSKIKTQGKTIALVPTMGYFHDGHLQLMRAAVQKGHEAIVSIFVNPTQFSENEDFNNYPRNIQRDLAIAEENNVNAVFLPEQAEMYPFGYKTYVEVAEISEVMCGKYRPTHFRGVATVVLKLFNIIQPDEAFFGQKDGQQLLIIKKMTEDLNLGINIETVATIRESDGLAMSSRNVYLNKQQRDAATVLYRSLMAVKKMVAAGEKDVGVLVSTVANVVASEPLAELQYIDIRSTKDFSAVTRIDGEIMVALAVNINKVRLIDNIVLKME